MRPSVAALTISYYRGASGLLLSPTEYGTMLVGCTTTPTVATSIARSTGIIDILILAGDGRAPITGVKAGTADKTGALLLMALSESPDDRHEPPVTTAATEWQGLSRNLDEA